MQFELDDDRALLQRSIRELLEKEAPLAETRVLMEESPEGYSKPFFSGLGQLGYFSLLLPEEQGGMGALAFAAVLAEAGRVALPGPLLELALAVRVLADCGAADAEAWRERAEAGDALVVLARTVEGVASEPPRFASGRLRGTLAFVPYGASADALLVETPEGLVLAERPGAGWGATPLPTLDHAQRFAQIAFDGPARLLADAGSAERVLGDAARLATLGASALMLGLMDRALEIAVAYVSEREAFGVPIGSFQALQHRCADMLLHVESTRSAVFRAAWAEEAEPDSAAYLAAVAKAWAGPAGRFVCSHAIQLLGGVGFTWEYDPHVYLKRIKTLEQFHGSTRAQLEAALEHSPLLRVTEA